MDDDEQRPVHLPEAVFVPLAPGHRVLLAPMENLS